MPPRKKNTTKTTKKTTNSTETRHAVTVRIPNELHGVHASLANANRFNKVITELLRMYSNVREVQEYINAQLSSNEQKAEDATKRLVQVLNAPMFVDSDTPDSANNSHTRKDNNSNDLQALSEQVQALSDIISNYNIQPVPDRSDETASNTGTENNYAEEPKPKKVETPKPAQKSTIDLDSMGV